MNDSTSENTSMKNEIIGRIKASAALKLQLVSDNDLLDTISRIAGLIIEALKQDKKIMFCGNGGSAADAQHLSAELSGRFYLDRRPLYAEALHVNSSFMTAVANDYDYEEVYARLVKAKGRAGDVLVALSTSGQSPNILKAVSTANELGMITVGLTGQAGDSLQNLCVHTIRIPSKDTPRIQECHILIGHIICEMVEKEFASS